MCLTAPLPALRKGTDRHTTVLVRFNAREGPQELFIDFDDAMPCRVFVDTLGALLETPMASSAEKPTSSPSPSTAAGLGATAVEKPPVDAMASATVTTDARGVQRVSYASMGFTGFVSMEVVAPLSVELASETYVVYAVHTRVRMLGTAHEVEWLVYHRYSDFEALDATLRKLVASNVDSLAVLLPTMPAKPWVPIGQFGRDWMLSRCRKLHRYITALERLPELHKNPHYLELLLRFASEGEHHQHAGGPAAAPNGAGESDAQAYFEKGMYGVNAALGAIFNKRELPSPAQDYEYVRDMFLKQGLVPKKVPWNKLVVTGVFIVSSFFDFSSSHGCFLAQCLAPRRRESRRSYRTSSRLRAQPRRVRVKWIQGSASSRWCLRRSFFATPRCPPSRCPTSPYVSSRSPLCPLPKTSRMMPATDACLCTASLFFLFFLTFSHFPFRYLDSDGTLDRYREQLGTDSASLAQYHKIRTVLINERYLNGPPEDVSLAKKIILIDSKGVDASSMGGGERETERGLRYLQSEIKAFQMFQKMSNLTLFMMPAGDLRNCEAALTIFELSVVCSEEGMNFLTAEIKKAAASPAGAAAVHVHYANDPVAGLLSRVLGIDQLYGAAKSVGSWAASKVSALYGPADPGEIDHGTARWEKTFFVLSRVDELYRAGHETHTDPRQIELQVFYELGVAFGKRLRHLEPPTFARVCTLGLPERQPRDQKQYVGFLNTFKAYLLRQTSETTYSRNRDDAIIAMVDELTKYYNSGWISSAYLQMTAPALRDVRARAVARRFSLAK